MPNNSADEKMLQCVAALPTKLYPEASHVGHAGQSRIAALFLASFATKMADEEDLVVIDEQPESQKEKKKKKKKKKKRDEGEASLEGFESRNFK